MPIISRDAIKEGYVNTYGVKHDQFPPNKNKVMSNVFFGIVSQHLAGKIPVVIEATSQHQVWESRIGQIQELDHPFIVVCFIDGLVAAKRHLQRGLENPRREFFHGDKRVTIYKETGVLSPPDNYSAPDFAVPTIKVSTAGEYTPCIDYIMNMIQPSDT
ncbi:hypothetical protein CMK14_03575 [Candidatus Poribacteria bacterium]|nr:hypothetical protein [Candidatus Poribacteria bacterium]